MSLLEAAVLGLVQGLTEFLPISSTAHLRIVPELLGWQDPGTAYSALIQLGTLVAILLAMREDVISLVRGFCRGVASGRPWSTLESRASIMIILGTIPIVIVGLAARDFIRSGARDLAVITGALVGGAVLMAVAEVACLARAHRSVAGRDGMEGVRLVDALTMGLAQVFALIPGSSRSGMTISAGMLTGLDRRTAARFSFLLSLPAIGAAGLLEAWKARHEILATGDDITAAIVGTVVAGIAGYLSIRWLLKLLTSHTLWPFVVYRLALAAVLATLLLSGDIIRS